MAGMLIIVVLVVASTPSDMHCKAVLVGALGQFASAARIPVLHHTG
jgi:hypothetical protein